MQVNALFATTQIVSSLISNDIIKKAIGDTSNTIYTLLYGLLDYQDIYLERILEKLDIKVQIKCVEGIIKNLNNYIIDKSLETALENLHEIICKINLNRADVIIFKSEKKPIKNILMKKI